MSNEECEISYPEKIFLGASSYDSQKQHDIDMMVKAMYDTMRWYGVPFLIRRQWSLDDYNAGLVERCSCYNENYDQPASYNCPSCFGYGFEGGFAEPEFIYVTIAGNLGYKITYKDKQGWREDRESIRIALVGDKICKEGDVIARIEDFDCNGNPSKIGDVWALNGTVKRQEEWGLSEPYNLKFGRCYKQVERLVSMTASADLLLVTDSRNSNEFWRLP